MIKRIIKVLAFIIVGPIIVAIDVTYSAGRYIIKGGDFWKHYGTITDKIISRYYE